MGAPGCDDAPLIEVAIKEEPRAATVVYPYYENPFFFRKQLKHWLSLPPHLAMMLSFIVVDDGSPEHPAEVILREQPFPLRLFRIDVDVRWNWLAARNIGFHHAADGWCVVTDMDHIIPSDVFETIIYGDLDVGTIYRFRRREHTGISIHPHPNSWLMTREMYWRVGGYDETMSGYYGTDGDYRRRCVKAAPIRILTDELERHEYQGDSSTTRYKRKQPEDARVKQLIAARPKKGWKPKTLSFPYHEVDLA